MVISMLITDFIQPHTFLTKLIFLLSVLLDLFFLRKSLQIMLFYISTITAVCFAYNAEFKFVNTKILRVSDQHYITLFCKKHTKMSQFLSQFNSSVVAPFFCAYIIFIFPYCSYSGSYIFYNLFSGSAIYAGVFTQAFFILTPLAIGQCLVEVNRRVVASKSKLSSTLASCQGTTKERWKCYIYLEHLKQLKLFTAGPLGSITQWTSLQCLFTYFAFLMFFGSHFITKIGSN